MTKTIKTSINSKTTSIKNDEFQENDDKLVINVSEESDNNSQSDSNDDDSVYASDSENDIDENSDSENDVDENSDSENDDDESDSENDDKNISKYYKLSDNLSGFIGKQYANTIEILKFIFSYVENKKLVNKVNSNILDFDTKMENTFGVKNYPRKDLLKLIKPHLVQEVSEEFVDNLSKKNIPKPKKNSKQSKTNTEDDDVSDSKNKSRKNTKKSKSESDVEDEKISNDIKSKTKKTSKKSKVESEDDEEVEKTKPKSKRTTKKSKVESEDDEEVEKTKPKSKRTTKKSKVESEDDEEVEKTKPKSKRTTKKSKVEFEDDEDDDIKSKTISKIKSKKVIKEKIVKPKKVEKVKKLKKIDFYDKNSITISNPDCHQFLLNLLKYFISEESYIKRIFKKKSNDSKLLYKFYYIDRPEDEDQIEDDNKFDKLSFNNQIVFKSVLDEINAFIVMKSIKCIVNNDYSFFSIPININKNFKKYLSDKKSLNIDKLNTYDLNEWVKLFSSYKDDDNNYELTSQNMRMFDEPLDNSFKYTITNFYNKNKK